MNTPWLHIVGIGEDGEHGLSTIARSVISRAEVIIGGARHHRLIGTSDARLISWPTPFDALIDTIRGLRGQRVVVLTTGDPLWYSVGSVIANAIPAQEIIFHPQVSAFQWVAARLGWSMAHLETLTAHGRPIETVIPHVAPDQRLIILSADATTPTAIARWLASNGYGASKMHVFASVGGDGEAHYEGVAGAWDHQVPDFNTVALECVAGSDARILPKSGLPDDAFSHDGKMTKREVRAITLSKLIPLPGALLWDVGAGCGSISIEWMRAAKGTRAIAIEPKQTRIDHIAENAARLGAPGIEIINDTAPAALATLPPADAIFLGGGLSAEICEACLSALKPHGRLVANCVTLQSEAILLDLYNRHGGELARIDIARASPVGTLTAWRTQMPVTQWHLTKPGEQTP